MRSIGLGFHDVIDAEDREAAALHERNVYTLDLRRYRSVLEAIARRVQPTCIRRARDLEAAVDPVYLTFDDGADNAYTQAAGELERFGWRGHFFPVAGLIGARGYLNVRQIRELHDRGHIIGSHSLTHPERMPSLSWTELIREWSESCALLAAILEEPVRVAAIPGGYYHRNVARAAATCGLEVLFTSEPTASAWRVDGCLVLGRYAVRRFTRPATVAAMAAGACGPRFLQSAAWLASKGLKGIAGERYRALRKAVLDRVLNPVGHPTHS